ncbi:MAG: S41 family peptidase [Pyrinomonadaceae bacterium]
MFDDAWETIRDRYYDPKFHGVDWEAQRAEFRPLAADARDAQEFYSVLRRMISALQDAHTRVFAPDEKFDWRHPRAVTIGISIREVEGQPTVSAVDKGSEAERAGLRAGDILTKIDDEPALELFAEKLKEQNGSSTRASARLRALAAIAFGVAGSTVNVAWRDWDGRDHAATLTRGWREFDTSLSVRELKDGYALVEFGAFTQDAARSLMSALPVKLRKARGIIIDLRGNGGGEGEAMAEMASPFLPPGESLGLFIGRNGRAQSQLLTRDILFFSPVRVVRTNAPLIILTSERTASAAEIFAASMRERGRATVIGTNTCGCVLAISRNHKLPDGGELDVSEMDYHTAQGARLEGIGVTPDETVTLNRRDLHSRIDRAMERAIERLKTKE